VPYLYPMSVFWSARAELRCAQILETLKKWDQAASVYRRLVERNVKESEAAKERLEVIMTTRNI